MHTEWSHTPQPPRELLADVRQPGVPCPVASLLVRYHSSNSLLPRYVATCSQNLDASGTKACASSRDTRFILVGE